MKYTADLTTFRAPRSAFRVSAITALTITAFGATSFAEEPLEKPATSGSAAESTTITVDPAGRSEKRTIIVGEPSKSLTVHAIAANTDAKRGPGTWLGISMDEMSEALASQLPIDPGTGLLIQYVAPESPAAKAGLQKNDVLVRLDDQVLITPKQMQTLIANHKSGEQVSLTYFRKGEKHSTSVTLEASAHAVPGTDEEITIDLGGVKMNLDRIIAEAGKAASSVITNKKVVILGADGKPVVIDGANFGQSLIELLEENGLKKDVLEEVKRALEKTRAQVEDARENASKQVEEARKKLDTVIRGLDAKPPARN